MQGAAYRRFLNRLDSTRAQGVDFGLDRVKLALSRLGGPERRLMAVQVAGTNGKGSTVAMTDSILRASGLRCGLFTSPHLCRFSERIRIQGAEADGAALAALDARIVATGVPLTYFEVATVLAVLTMADAAVDVAVLETGLGGRLDAVTAVPAVATAITSIGLDHTDLLGPSVVEIAREKAGIARPGVPLFVGPLAREALAEVVRVAAVAGAPVRLIPEGVAGPLGALALSGAHQRQNAAIAVALARHVATALGRPLPDAAVAQGLSAVSWSGRMERLAPDLLIDCAHNVDGARALVAALPAPGPRSLVISIVRGKDAAGILSVLAPHFDHIFVTRSNNARACDPHALLAMRPDLLGALGGSWHVVDDPVDALARARAAVAPQGGGTGGLAVVAGSMFLVGQLLAFVRGEICDPAGGGDPLP